MMWSGSAVQTKGLGRMLCSARKRLMAAWRSTSGMEDASLEASCGELGEEALDGVQPRGGGWGEVEGEARVAIEPGADLGVLVGGVVVEDDVDGLVRPEARR